MSPGAAGALADQQALTRLVTEYAYAIDERRWDRLDAIFTPDAYIDYCEMGGIDGPYPKVKAWLPEALKHFPGYMHFIGNLLFDVNGDEATGKVACLNPMRVPRAEGKGEDVMLLGLWYQDRYRRTAAGWRITQRVEKRSFYHNMPEWMRKALRLGED
jgi:hypothetical protein